MNKFGLKGPPEKPELVRFDMGVMSRLDGTGMTPELCSSTPISHC